MSNVVTYVKTLWKDLPLKTSRINAINLNHMEQGIENVTAFCNTLVPTDNNYTTIEKNKLSGIEANANNYILPKASASILGGVKIDGVTILINSDGVIRAVGGGGAGALEDLTDVDLESVVDGQILSFNHDEGKWVNTTPSDSVQSLKDVTIEDLTDGQLLVFDVETSKWGNKSLELAGLHDLAISNKTSGQTILYDSLTGKWENHNLSRVAITGNFDDLNDGPKPLSYQATLAILNSEEPYDPEEEGLLFLGISPSFEEFTEIESEQLAPPEV